MRWKLISFLFKGWYGAKESQMFFVNSETGLMLGLCGANNCIQ